MTTHERLTAPDWRTGHYRRVRMSADRGGVAVSRHSPPAGWGMTPDVDYAVVEAGSQHDVKTVAGSAALIACPLPH